MQPSFPIFHEAIMSQIFSYLPKEELTNVLSVNKHWSGIIISETLKKISALSIEQILFKRISNPKIQRNWLMKGLYGKEEQAKFLLEARVKNEKLNPFVSFVTATFYEDSDEKVSEKQLLIMVCNKYDFDLKIELAVSDPQDKILKGWHTSCFLSSRVATTLLNISPPNNINELRIHLLCAPEQSVERDLLASYSVTNIYRNKAGVFGNWRKVN